MEQLESGVAQWMSSEVLMIAGTAVLSYLVMVVGRKIYNSVAPQGGPPDLLTLSSTSL